ncbi:hypothetical protein Cgig2_028621 [Carnegiea gigantea]|uniref:Serpin domain-containing protein n=1 Tax=Carnegiea gigantea TaxID=171969 RepID=A0A9Q1QCZ2_9CARY|nr:hypothetical protein Cgig2_028621 [Carnegiea gigantea]
MDLRQAIADQTDVSLSIAKHVASIEAKSTNLVFSPASLHVLLSLIASGSSCPTREQVLSFLRSKSSDDLNKLSSELVAIVFADGSPAGGPKLSSANGLWVDQTLPLKSTFKQVVDDVYKAAFNQVDFLNKLRAVGRLGVATQMVNLAWRLRWSVSKHVLVAAGATTLPSCRNCSPFQLAAEVTYEVNSWAEKETSGLIKEVLPPGSVDNTTRLIFANAIYFKGAWNDKFDASQTKEDDFHLLNGSLVKVHYMTSKKKQFIRAFDGFKVLRLPYKQGEDKRSFSMYFYLPDAKDGLPALVEEISSQSGFLDQHHPHDRVKVGDFKLPRFKMSFGFEASNVLKGLGVELPFSRGGLTEMVDSPVAQNLYVSSIFHKSFIEINEEGTEAAAASAGVIALRSFTIAQQLDFVADHPFIFLIREDMTGVVLFIGHVMNPLES